MLGTLMVRLRSFLVCTVPWAALYTACGDDDEREPKDGVAALPAGTVALDPSDVGPERGDDSDRTDATDDGAPGLDDGDQEAEQSDGTYRAFLAAHDRELRALCACRFAELGHDSPDSCFENLRRPDFARTCELLAFSQYSAALAARYSCLGGIRDVSASCVEASCSGIDECEATRDAARATCGGLVPEDAAFVDFDTACERPVRLGAPSGCPDVRVANATLGTIFEGQTTGAGDDVTLSCHWDFEGFESADVVVEWQAPAAGGYRFSTENSNFVTQIGVLDGCGGAELACASSSGSRFGAAEVTLELAAMQTVWIVVEGYSVTDSGYAALSVNAAP